MDENKFREELLEIMKAVDRDYEQLVARQKPAIPYLLEANRKLKNTNLGVTRRVSGIAE